MAEFIDHGQIRAVRGYFNYSQTEFAQTIGVARSSLAAVEQGVVEVSEYMHNKVVEFCSEYGVIFKQHGFVVDLAKQARR